MSKDFKKCFNLPIKWLTVHGTRKAVVFATMAKLSTDGSLGLGKIHAMQLFDEVVSVEQSKD